MHSEPLDADEVARAIVRVLSGDLPEREEIALRRWLDADAERRQLFEEMRAVWEEAGAAQRPWDTSGLARRIMARRAPRPRHSRRLPRIAAMAGSSGRRLALAATILVVASTGLFYAATRSRPRDEAARIAFKEIVTRRGERASVQLPEGSRITLGPESRLRYPDRLDTMTTREVRLSGDAYFEITHDAARPFVVRTALAVARDLGTAFRVRAHDDMPHVDVIVVEGRVSLSAPNGSGRDSLLLAPRDLGRVDSAGNLGVSHDVDLATTLAWTRGQLAFRDALVPEVVAEIARTYDVELRIGDPMLRDVRFSGSFDAASAADVVGNFATSIGAVVQKRNGAFVLIRRVPR